MNALPPALLDRLPASLPAYVRRCVTIDTRSLAAFRIAVALLIIADVLLRSRNFHFYYTDEGAVPQSLTELYLSEFAVSVFFFTNDTNVIAALFVLHALIALVLLFGYKTRLMLVLSFILVISVDHHNRLVLSYADTLFRMLLFWAIFLPLGERWSIDALQRDRAPRRSVASLATAAIMLQMVYMYVVNGLNKYPSNLWHSGEAAIIVMGIDEMTFLLGDFMRNFPLLLQIGGRTWFTILLLSPLLILLYGRTRYPLILLFVGGHASFAITVRIGAFAYVALAGLMVFLQPRFWGDVGLVLSRLRVDRLTRSIHGGVTRFGASLATRVPGPLFAFPGRDLFVRRTLTVLVAIAMIGLFVFPAFALSAESPYVEESPLPGDNPIDDIVGEWSVAQPNWSIFAGPGPRNVDRYYVFPARTADGEVFDLYNERPMTYDRPGQQLQHQHDTYRQRFYMNSIRRAGMYGSAPAHYADYLCEYWAEEHGVELTHINMYEVRERITLETIDDPDNRTRSIRPITQQACGDHEPMDIEPPEEDDE